MEDGNGNGVADPPRDTKGAFDTYECFVKERHASYVQRTAKLTMYIFNCCQINLYGTI